MEIQIPVPSQVEEILSVLNSHGYEAYIVGGCVRDMILGRAPGDWDITTSALPQDVKKLFRRTLDTGIQHGTVTIMMGKNGYEVTTYRIDGDYSDGRHPDSVTFTPNLIEDLKRRDFTINAMAYNPSVGFVDAFGGQEDLKAGIIRCVGKATDRFGEDALRILRAIRFSAQLGFAIEKETEEAVRDIAPNIAHVSKERIQVELTKLLVSAHPEKISLVHETGVSRYLSDAFLKACEKAGREGSLGSIPTAIPAEKALRWAACLRACEPAEAVKVLKELKMDNDTISRVKTLTEWIKKPLCGERVADLKRNGESRILCEKAENSFGNKADLRRVMSRMSPQLFDGLLMIKKCLAAGDAQAEKQLGTIFSLTEEIRKAQDCISLKTLAVTGNDVIQAGVKPGKEVGEALNRLFELVLENPAANTKEELLSHL